MAENFLIIDANSILNRAFYGIKHLSTKSGLPTNALFGFAKTLKRLLDEYTPTYAACAFDVHAPTFRHEMSPAYKANRTGMPDELRLQLPYAHRLAEAMGFTVCEKPGYEGDDVIGTLADLGAASGLHSYIATGDKDSLQLLSPGVSVVLIKTGEDVLYTPERFTAEYGVTPAQYVDVKALMGDKSDNIPGVAGVGEKTAFKLIADNGSLDAIYADIAACGATKSVAAKLEAARDAAFLSRRLAEICRSVPGYDDVAPYRTGGFHDAGLCALFTELELFSLIPAFSLSGAKAQAASLTAQKKHAPGERLVTPSELLGAAAALGEGAEAVVSAAQENGAVTLSLLTPDAILTATGEAAGFSPLFSRPVVCHDAKKLFKIFSPAGVEAKVAFDTMLAAYLLSPGDSKYPVGRVVGAFAPDLPADAPEVWLCGELRPILEKKLGEAGEGLALLTEMEIPLARVLCDMERDGVLLDADGVRRYSDSLLDAQNRIEQSVFDLSGEEFNLNSPKQLGEVLFGKLGLPHGRKTQNGYSTDADTLGKLRYAYPVADAVLRYREVAKLRSTYGEALAAQADENGRVHTTFNQCGTATGRLSSVDPNLQNIPVRSELGRELRRYFTAPQGKILVDADYSQIELRLLAALSGDENMIAAFASGADIHTSTAAQVFHVAPEEVTSQLRSRAKAVNFGIVYGIGDYSLSQDLGISRREAAQYIERYLATYPGVAKYLEDSVESAKRLGYTETMFGRRRPIPELASRNRNVVAFGERVARNSPIQGSAADVIKLAMISVHRRLAESGLDARLILQVHDELIVECAEDDASAVAALLKECMESAASTAVLLRADVAVGKTWYEAKG